MQGISESLTQSKIQECRIPSWHPISLSGIRYIQSYSVQGCNASPSSLTSLYALKAGVLWCSVTGWSRFYLDVMKEPISGSIIYVIMARSKHRERHTYSQRRSLPTGHPLQMVIISWSTWKIFWDPAWLKLGIESLTNFNLVRQNLTCCRMTISLRTLHNSLEVLGWILTYDVGGRRVTRVVRP